MITEAESSDEIERCFETMSQLRPALARNEFVNLIRDMFTEGFRLAYLEHEGRIACVAGFRITTTLFMGKNLYVDDLVTNEKDRSLGLGRAMLEWLRELAIDNGCDYLHLDSGTQRTRAHKFYLSEGLSISAFHFSQKLNERA